MTEEINPDGLPVIPDSIARKIDKGQDVAIEEVREAALDNIKAGKTNPVHAENLRPISKAEATKRTTFGKSGSGTSLPSFPQTRRVIPEPFKRPSINADRHGKSWQWIRADLVVPGDIVPDVGEVYKREERVIRASRAEVTGVPGSGAEQDTVAVGTRVRLYNANGRFTEHAPGDEVHVFRK